MVQLGRHTSQPPFCMAWPLRNPTGIILIPAIITSLMKQSARLLRALMGAGANISRHGPCHRNVESAGNCRSDASKIQNSQSYNIGTGAQSLISSWNTTAGVSSKNATNDPYKANHWFFAVWSYNGSYGNNPNDVASSVYGHWYPGAPFRSIYEEYVWYYAAHPQSTTDNYQPSLGSNPLPPQSDFTGTSDSYVAWQHVTFQIGQAAPMIAIGLEKVRMRRHLVILRPLLMQMAARIH